MSALTIRLPDDKYQRLKEGATGDSVIFLWEKSSPFL
jgi:hypothetical protein